MGPSLADVAYIVPGLNQAPTTSTDRGLGGRSGIFRVAAKKLKHRTTILDRSAQQATLFVANCLPISQLSNGLWSRRAVIL